MKRSTLKRRPGSEVKKIYEQACGGVGWGSTGAYILLIDQLS